MQVRACVAIKVVIKLTKIVAIPMVLLYNIDNKLTMSTRNHVSYDQKSSIGRTI